MKILKVGLGASILLMANSIAFAGHAMDWSFNPYVGADAQVRRMDFKGGFGDNLLQHHSPQGNVYGGLMLNSSMALEAGYEATTTRTRTMTMSTGDVVNGISLPANMSPTVYKSKAKIKGPHLDLVGYYCFHDAPVKLIGSVGVAKFKATMQRATIQIQQTPSSVIRTLTQRKAVLRLMGGLEYMYTDNWGFRATFGWVNTSKLTIRTNDGGRTSPEVKPKESSVYGLGTLWRF